MNYCEKTLGITNEAARKRLQRLPSHIFKIKGICRDKQSILYHKDKWIDIDFLDKLVDILKHNARQHYAVLNALKLSYGFISRAVLAEYTISPFSNIKGHKNFYTIIQDLISLRLVKETDDYFVALGDYATCNDKRSKALDVIHRITIDHFHEWGRNIGLFSYDSANFHREFSSYQFAMVAPSYINSLVSKSQNGKNIPAFVVADILLNRDIDKDDIEFFIKKLENVFMRNTTARIIPFLLIGTHSRKYITF